MKRLFILSLLLLAAITARAQRMTTEPGARLYLQVGMKEDRVAKFNYEPIVLRRSCQVTYNGLAKSSFGLHYDGYIVIYNDARYYVSRESVMHDDVLIDPVNAHLDSLQMLYQHDIDYLDAAQAKEKDRMETDRIEKIKKLKKENVSLRLLLPRLDSLIERHTDSTVAAYKTTYTNRMKYLGNQAKNLSKRIDITRCELVNNGGDCCDLRLTYTNTSNKTIKALRWIGTATNTLGEPISCAVTDAKVFYGEDSGLYAPGKTSECCFAHILWNITASSINISRIEIDYTDGSSYAIDMTQRDWIDYQTLRQPYREDVIRAAAKDAALKKYGRLEAERTINLNRAKIIQYEEMKTTPLFDYYEEQKAEASKRFGDAYITHEYSPLYPNASTVKVLDITEL